MEREGQIIACAALFPFLEEKCGEVAAIAVSPECRGQGQGDKLLGMALNTCLKAWDIVVVFYHIFWWSLLALFFPDIFCTIFMI